MGLREDIEEFAGEYDCIVDKTILKNVLDMGRCPCKIDYVGCPCDEAPVKIENTGRCHCGLFRKR